MEDLRGKVVGYTLRKGGVAKYGKVITHDVKRGVVYIESKNSNIGSNLRVGSEVFSTIQVKVESLLHELA